MASTGIRAAPLQLLVVAMILIFATACSDQGSERLVFEEDFEGALAGTMTGGATVVKVGNGRASALLLEPGESYVTKIPIWGSSVQASFQMLGHIRPDATLNFRAVAPSGARIEKAFSPVDARTWQAKQVDLNSLAGEIVTITIEVSEADLESQVLISGLKIVDRSAGALTAADFLPYGVLAVVAVSIMLAVGVGVGTYRRLRFSVAEGAAKVGGLDVRMTDLRRYFEEQNSQLARTLSPIEDVQDEMTRLGGRFEDVAAQTNELGSRSDAQANLFETLSQTVELSSARIDATATEVDQLAERVLANVRETERLVALQARLIHAMVSKSNEGGNIEYADAAAGGHD